MTYTILEVEHISGISSRKIRFWLDKGLFPHIHKDKNGVRLFNQKDIDWLCWIELYRRLGISIKEILHYKSDLKSFKIKRQRILLKWQNYKKQLQC